MSIQTQKRPLYRGRFAPSPSGLLHYGSLITALASYLDAKSHQGTWLVRIEDIDPPREQAGAAKAILATLEAFGLHWDEEVLFQSQQSDYYKAIIAELFDKKLAYYCQCTRAAIKKLGGVYQGHCRQLEHPKVSSAIRVKNDTAIAHYHDLFQQEVNGNIALANEDFTIFRKDGLFAYQLAVVADDIAQNISHVIRGCDLLEPTVRQINFFNILQRPVPQYGHVPLAVTDQGYKLSKQNKAPAIDNSNPQPTLIKALNFLGQNPPKELANAKVEEITAWGIANWQRNAIPQQAEIVI